MSRQRISFVDRFPLIACCFALSTGLLLSGCGADKHPELRGVRGRVTYNGDPVANATLAFYNDESPRPATGRTDAEGNFYLTTFEDDDGALPGEHKVVVIKIDDSRQEDEPELSMDEALEAPRKRIKRRRGLLPKQYAQIETTPLVVTVSENEPNDVTLALTD